MTDPRRQAFAPYVRDLADRLRLRDWTIYVRDDPPHDGECIASIHCVEGRKVANIRFNDPFLDDSPEDQRHTIVHELLHCHVNGAWDYAVDTFATEDARRAFRRLAETAVDGLADAIAPLLPLPGIAAGRNDGHPSECNGRLPAHVPRPGPVLHPGADPTLTGSPARSITIPEE